MNKSFVVLCLLLFTSLGHIFADEWLHIDCEKISLSFKIPGKPVIEEINLNGIYVKKYNYEDVANVFGVVVSDFSGVGVDFSLSDNQDYYEAMKQASLATGNAILISEQSIAYKNMLGKEIVYTIMIKGKEYTYYKRFFFRRNMVFQIVIGGVSRMKRLLIDKKDLFFNSFIFD